MSRKGPERGYVETLDDETVKRVRSAPQVRSYNPLRPSSAGECEMKLGRQFMEYRGKAEYTVEQREAKIERLLDIGHYIERQVIEQFGRVSYLKPVYKQQVVTFFEIAEKQWLEGSIDLCFISDEHKCVADVKSKGDKFSVTHRSKWDENSDDYDKMQSVERVTDTFFYIRDLDAFLAELKDPFFRMNFYQLNMYAHSEFLKQRGIDHGVILQYNKNDSRMREFRFELSENAYNYVKDKFLKVRDVVDSDRDIETELVKEHRLGSAKCAYCEYAPKCYPGTNSSKEYYATLPDKEWPRDTKYLGAVGSQLEALYEQYKEVCEMSGIALELEEDIVTLLDAQKVRKIRFSDGGVYEVKFLKTPKPHLELRKSKA